MTKILEQTPLSAWCRDRVRVSGLRLAPQWTEEGNGGRFFADLILTDPDSGDAAPVRAHCVITNGRSGEVPDALGLGLDVLLSIPLPPIEGDELPRPPLNSGKLSIEELAGLTEIVTRSAILAAKEAAAELLSSDTVDGHLAVWLATAQSLDQVIDLTKFPAIGNQVAPSEVSLFASLPLEPGQTNDSAEFGRSLRGLAVELVHELLRTGQRRDYIEYLHLLREQQQ